MTAEEVRDKIRKIVDGPHSQASGMALRFYALVEIVAARAEDIERLEARVKALELADEVRRESLKAATKTLYGDDLHSRGLVDLTPE